MMPNNNPLENKLTAAIGEMPVVAIIRGVQLAEVADIANAIYEAGVRVIEVPLNTPNAFECIRLLSDELKAHCMVGCGTLTQLSDIPKLVEVGAELAVTPSTQPDLIKECLDAGLLPMPGCMTPTEAFAALHAGATQLKLFPASTVGSGHLAAMKAVLPHSAQVYAVGGVKLSELTTWKKAGATGFGFGSEIFKPGMTAKQVFQATRRVVAAVNASHAS